MYSFEERLFADGVVWIAGVDEAGRGPLAGPVVASAVILPAGERIPGIKDSKQLSPKKREQLFNVIRERAAFGVGIVDESWIDRLNILEATCLAMRKAVLNLPRIPECILVDGNVNVKVSCRKINIVRGDTRSASIAAASIIAKVTRDRMMRVYDLAFPHYRFRVHKGYPTPEHVRLLCEHGPSPIHRFSFRPVKENTKSYARV